MKGAAVAILAVGVLTAACATGAPPSPSTATMGAVQIQVARVAGGNEFFASEHHAQLVRVGGSLVADWKINPEAVAPVSVPAGDYRLDTSTVFFSDFLQCTADPGKAGAETCFQPTLGPGEICSVPITVTANATVEAQFTILPDAHCRLEAGAPPASPSAGGTPPSP
jgi:hypothetical protein